MSAQPVSFLTPEQYLEIERKAETKSEYLGGVMYSMPGGSFPHAVIIGRLTAALINRLANRGCYVTPSDLRLRVSPKGLYTYPDIMIICGKPLFSDEHGDVVENPLVIMEVLSPSTEAYDRGGKFSHYQTISSLQEYILVSQTQPRVERYRRLPDERWILTNSNGLDAVLQLESVPCEIPLAEIYSSIDFSS